MTQFDETIFNNIDKISSSILGSIYLLKSDDGSICRKKEYDINIHFSKEKQEQEFIRSLNVISQMKHPAINKILHYTIPNNNSIPITIFSEFEPNGSLEDLVNRCSTGQIVEQWDSTHKMMTIFGTAAALMYLHGSRIIHKNLKPTNILFNSDFEPKIADFDFTKHQKMNSSNSCFVSEGQEEVTPLCVAPELLDQQTFNNKVDVYSYAILLFFILTGKYPDYGMDDQEAIKAAIIIGNRPNIPDNLVPKSYKHLISECWDNNSSNRPTFKTIIRRLTDVDYILPGTDIDKYLKYTQKVIHNDFLLKNVNTNNQNEQSSRVNEIQAKADSGDVESQYEYAVMLNTGKGVPRRNVKEAMKYFQKASDNGNLQAMHDLALLHESMQNWKDAELLLRIAADKGHKDSQFHYALMLKNGTGVGQDIFKAAKYFRLSANQGDSDAQNSYAMMLFNGEGVIPNKNLAAQYFKKAADQGDSDAQNSYGMLLITGDINQNNYNILSKNTTNILQNVALGREYLKKSAYQNNANGMLNYADILLKEGKRDRAALYYYRSSKLGNEEAQRKYDSLNIFIYSDDEDEYEIEEIENKKKETQIVEQQKQSLHSAADKGDPQAQFEYAMFLKDKSNKIQSAIVYFELASNQNHPEATFELGKLYRNGIGVEKNLKKARKYFLSASELGVSDSTAAYGWMRYKGVGFTKTNLEKSRKYLEKSASQKSADGMAFYGRFLLDLIEKKKKNLNNKNETNNETNNDIHNEYNKIIEELKKEQKNAINLIKNSADLENKNGLYFLAMILKEQENPEYISLLRKAESKGSWEALFEVSLSDNDLSKMKIAADKSLNEKVCFTYATRIKDSDASESFWYFSKSAEDGNSAAMIEWAKALWKSNPQKCESYLKHAINNNKYPPAYAQYGLFLSEQKGEYHDAAHNYHIAAALGDTDGMLYYGLAFKDGKGVTKNEKKALKYLKMSADRGNVEGMLQFALLIDDFDESMEYFKKAVDGGNDEACYYLAMIYKDMGEYEIALNLLKKASENGHDDSLFQVAVFYQNGLGVPKDNNMAMNYYALSANTNRAKPAAQFNYALMLKNVSKNLPLAAKYFKAAANLGDPEAMNNYGIMLMKGEGIPKNLKEAEKYFRMSSDLNNSFGLNNLGILLKKDNPNEAQNLFKRSMQLGNLSGMNNYALSIQDSNPNEAKKVFKTAADLGHVNAMYNYATILKNELSHQYSYNQKSENNHTQNKEHDVRNDDQNDNQKNANSKEDIQKEIMMYMKNAAKQGEINAMNSLGSIFKQQRNFKKALKYYQRASNAGSTSAMNNYATLLKDCCEGDSELLKKAIQLFEKAAAAGNTNAMNNLAAMYLKGEGVKKDIEKSKELYKQSMKLGNERATKNYMILSSPRKPKPPNSS